MASQSFCCCRGLPDVGRHALGFEDSLDVLRGAKMNVFSFVRQVFFHVFLDRIYRVQF